MDDILDPSVSTGAWLRDMAISGAIGGVIGFGLGVAASKVVPAATAAQTLSKSSIFLRVAGRAVANAAIGGVLGGGTQVGLNIATHQPWHQDVLRSAAIGAVWGAIFSGKLAICFVVPFLVISYLQELVISKGIVVGRYLLPGGCGLGRGAFSLAELVQERLMRALLVYPIDNYLNKKSQLKPVPISWPLVLNGYLP